MDLREEGRPFEAATARFRRFGSFGPPYEVLELRGEQARICVMDSGEELDYPTACLADDPEA